MKTSVTKLRTMTESDLRNLSTNEMEQVLKDSRQIINRKRRELEKAHYRYSPSLRILEKNKWWNKPTRDRRSKGERQEAKYRAKLVRKITETKNFVNSQSSTIGGMTRLNRQVAKRLGIDEDKLTESFLRDFWKVHDEVEDYIKEKGLNKKSEELQSEVYSYFHDYKRGKTDLEGITKTLKDEVDNIKATQNKNYKQTDVLKQQATSFNDEEEDNELPF